MTLQQVLVQLIVPDMDRALAFYEKLTATSPRARFRQGPLEVAVIGGFLLVSGDESATNQIKEQRATVVIDDLDQLHTWALENGCEIVAPLQHVPTGRNLVLRHPDGAVIEYVELGKPAVANAQ